MHQKPLLVYRFGPFELDEALVELRQDGKPVPLGPRPLLLLMHLVRSRHKLVTGDELRSVGWPDQKFVDPTAVRQTVHEIRKPLGDVGRMPRWIRNAPGLGYQFIGEVEERAAVSPPARSPDTLSSLPAFVDRDSEMAQLRATVQKVLEGRRRVVLLHGPRGIGKTRTALELANEAGDAGFDVHRGRAHEGAGAPPYWPWIEIFRSLAAVRGIDELRRAAGPSSKDLTLLLPQLADTPAAATSSSRSEEERDRERFGLFDGVTTLLGNLARSQPLLLILDDLHWADEVSLLLLAFIAQSPMHAPLLIVGAHRDLTPAAGGARAQALARARREFSAESIALHGLTPESVGRILELSLGFAPSAAFVRQVHERSGGNPFFVSEFARFMAAQKIRDGDAIPIPDRLRDIVWNWVSERSEPCRRLLQLASVIGPHCSLALLRRTFQGSAEELLEALAEAEQYGLLVREAPGSYGFTHGAIRETLYEELEERQRTALHRAIGQAIEVLHGPDLTQHLSELAHHFSESAVLAGAERAVHYARAAAAQARSMLAYEEATAHYRRALHAVDFQDPPDAELRCTLLVEFGFALAAAHAHVSEVTAALSRAIELARALHLPRLHARAAARIASYSLGKENQARFDPMVTAGLRTRLEPLLHEALEALGGNDDRLRGRVLLLLSRLAFPQQQHAQDLLAEAFDLAESRGDAILRVECLSVQWSLVPTLDRPDERLAQANEIVALARHTGRKDFERRGYGHLAYLALARGDRAALDDARRRSEGLREALTPDSEPSPSQSYLRAQLEGPLSAAHAAVKDTFKLGLRMRFTFARNMTVALIQRWWLALLQADHMAILHGWESSLVQSPHIRVAHAFVGRLYADLGDAARARSHIEPFNAEGLQQTPKDDQWLFYATAIAETAAMLRDLNQCAQLLEILSPYRDRFVTLSWSHICTGSMARTLGTLAAALGEWGQSEDFFARSRAHDESFRAPVLTVWSELEHARALHGHPRAVERRRAERLLESLAARAEELGMSGAIEHTRRRFAAES